MKTRKSDRGSALILAVVVTVVVAGMTGSYLTLSISKKNATFQEVEREKAFYAAEAAIAQAKYELTSGRDYETTGLGNVTLNTLANTQVTVTFDTTGLTGNQRRLTAIATYGPANKRTDRSIEEVVDKPMATPTMFAGGSITSRDGIDLQGSIDVDARDYDMAGTAIVGAGVDGIWSGGSVSLTGSAGVGGNGLAPPNNGSAPGAVEANHDWGADGVDNDRDGVVDQPGETFPTDPDQALGFPAGTMKAAAQNMGTYFSTQVAYTAALAANGGQMPGGKIIYCEFAPSPPFEVGTSMNAVPSILIMHNSTANAVAKNVHGSFKGLFMADKVEHVNAGTDVLGMVFAWGQFGNSFGNGNSTIRYSSAVLAGLPQFAPNPVYNRKSFREVVR